MINQAREFLEVAQEIRDVPGQDLLEDGLLARRPACRSRALLDPPEVGVGKARLAPQAYVVVVLVAALAQV